MSDDPFHIPIRPTYSSREHVFSFPMDICGQCGQTREVLENNGWVYCPTPEEQAAGRALRSIRKGKPVF